jgi:hypothetical protein
LIAGIQSTIEILKRGDTVALPYGFVKAKLVSDPWLKPLRLAHETQYHVHFNAEIDGASWDVAVNVGTDDVDDLLRTPAKITASGVRPW